MPRDGWMRILTPHQVAIVQVQEEIGTRDGVNWVGRGKVEIEKAHQGKGGGGSQEWGGGVVRMVAPFRL